MINKWSFLAVLAFFIGGCTSSNQLVPKHIGGKSLQIHFTDVQKLNPDFQGDGFYIEFFPDLIFKAFVNDSLRQEGNYAYNKINPTSARIQMDLQVFENSKMSLLELIFSTPQEGFFYLVDIRGSEGNAKGRFILEDFQKSAEQSEELQTKVDFSCDFQRCSYEQVHSSN